MGASCLSRLCCWISASASPRPPPDYLPCPQTHMETETEAQPPSSQPAVGRRATATTPYHNADCTIRAFAARAEGFGRDAIGGLHGPLYYVTSLQDDGRGTLRDACRIKEPLWIVFEVSGTIHLHSYLRVSSYKTIDGRGQRVKLTGKGLQLKDCHHVTVCNLEFEGGRGHDVDSIQIKPNSTHIWIDRCSPADYDDPLVMDMEFELQALRTLISDKTQLCNQLKKELAMIKRLEEDSSDQFELEGSDTLGSHFRIIPRVDGAPDIASCPT